MNPKCIKCEQKMVYIGHCEDFSGNAEVRNDGLGFAKFSVIIRELYVCKNKDFIAGDSWDIVEKEDEFCPNYNLLQIAEEE